jgi:hypothetical protein
MATKGQTHAKRDRERELRERRERKRVKKAEAAAKRAAGNAPAAGSGSIAPRADGQAETAPPEWIQ